MDDAAWQSFEDAVWFVRRFDPRTASYLTSYSIGLR
jgi:hypothetical protein